MHCRLLRILYFNTTCQVPVQIVLDSIFEILYVSRGYINIKQSHQVTIKQTTGHLQIIHIEYKQQRVVPLATPTDSVVVFSFFP